MRIDIAVVELLEDDWQRLRALRLESLADSPEAFGASYESELELPRETWIERMLVNRFFAAMVNEKDSAIMSVEELAGDFGSKIWLGGCWVHPDVRGTGIMKAMIEFIDSVASVRDWGCQGLGVWLDNDSAIAAYEKLGFVQVGETQESTRQPGKYYQRMIRHTK